MSANRQSGPFAPPSRSHWVMLREHRTPWARLRGCSSSSSTRSVAGGVARSQARAGRAGSPGSRRPSRTFVAARLTGEPPWAQTERRQPQTPYVGIAGVPGRNRTRGGDRRTAGVVTTAPRRRHAGDPDKPACRHAVRRSGTPQSLRACAPRPAPSTRSRRRRHRHPPAPNTHAAAQDPGQTRRPTPLRHGHICP